MPCGRSASNAADIHEINTHLDRLGRHGSGPAGFGVSDFASGRLARSGLRMSHFASCVLGSFFFSFFLSSATPSSSLSGEKGDA